MSISIPGTLCVIERNGRNGPFTVAEINTEIGQFKLKHRVLEQFSEGSYSGVFILTRIYNQSNFSKGQIWVSLCADLDWDALQIMAQSEQVQVSASLAVAELVAEHAADEAETADVPPATAIPVPDEDLVADLPMLQQQIDAGRNRIKLDGSMSDRDAFRQLRQALKDKGYRFDGQSQSWLYAEAA